MEWLRSQGYVGVSLNQVYDAWFKSGELPEKPVVISFDDGYRSQYVYARPELRKLGWPGDLSAIAGRIGQPNAELSNGMVRTLINDGWELDSHTINHVDVAQASGAQLQSEVAGSRLMLQRRFHQPINFFCYPAGRYDAEAIAGEPRVRVEGFTDRMPDWFAAADLLVHSSAGLTVLEALMSGCGVVSYGWGWGHVRVNNEAFARFGIAEVAASRAELREAMARALATRPDYGDYFARLPSAASAILRAARASDRLGLADRQRGDGAGARQQARAGDDGH
jgi:peptidoglycan/xylan/chitin deacetylase (PgdA/CDA1 family)